MSEIGSDEPAYLARRLADLDPSFAPLAPRFDAYLTLLQRWNRVHNLTAIDDYAAMVDKHLLDSLVCLPYLRGTRVLDVGSGAGIPGLVLAIADATRQYTLVEPAQKRALFLRQAVIELSLSHVEILKCRAEQIPGPGRWDTIVSRAFGDLDRLFTATQTLHVPGVRLVLMKGRRPDAELAAARERGFDAQLVALHLPGLAAERHLVLVDL